jgi:acetylornithine deacetylase/succinyl-diaminopimelate desuccinylase-like protein
LQQADIMNSLLHDVLALADEPGVRERLTQLLLDLLRINTTVGPDLERVRASEAAAFERIAAEVESIRGSRGGVHAVPIDPCIECDPYYTPAHYTKTADRPEGLPAAATYRDRSNRVLQVPGQGRGTLALNAHIDVVAPYIPPSVEEGRVTGRGACDDKGQVATLLLALELIEAARSQGHPPPADLLLEFVID